MFSFISRPVLVVSSSIPFVNYVYWSPEISVTCLDCQIHKYSTLVFIQKKRTRWACMWACMCLHIYMLASVYIFVLYSAQHSLSKIRHLFTQQVFTFSPLVCFMWEPWSWENCYCKCEQSKIAGGAMQELQCRSLTGHQNLFLLLTLEIDIDIHLLLTINSIFLGLLRSWKREVLGIVVTFSFKHFSAASSDYWKCL